tara:strand:+ start:70 stop:417 length:348 start_codon:yes stop_codon:yes gene_type:complete
MKQESIDREDFMLRIRPTVDNDGYWNGEIDVSIISQPDNTLSDEDYFQVMHFCKMIASTIPVMEMHEDFRNLVHKFVEERVDRHYDVELENKPTITEEEGNVVRINFDSKTKGNM